jgi:hypothetical protein
MAVNLGTNFSCFSESAIENKSFQEFKVCGG